MIATNSLLIAAVFSAALCVEGRPPRDKQYNSVDLIEGSVVNLKAGPNYAYDEQDLGDQITANEENPDSEVETFGDNEGSDRDQGDARFDPHSPKDPDASSNDGGLKPSNSVRRPASQERDYNLIKTIASSEVNLLVNADGSSDEDGNEGNRHYATFNHIEKIKNSLVNVIAEDQPGVTHDEEEQPQTPIDSSEKTDSDDVEFSDEEDDLSECNEDDTLLCQERAIKRLAVSVVQELRESYCKGQEQNSERCQALASIGRNYTDDEVYDTTPPVEETTRTFTSYRFPDY